MKGPVRFALALLAVALLVFLAVRENARDKAQGKQATQQLVFPYNTTQVQVLKITRSDPALSASFRRDASRAWVLADGSLGTTVDVVPDVLSSWSRVRFLSVLDEHPQAADLARLGLAPPAVVLEAELQPDTRTADGSVPRPPRLELGGVNKNAASVYARVDGFDRVVLVNVASQDLIDDGGRRIFGLTPKLPPESEDRQH